MKKIDKAVEIVRGLSIVRGWSDEDIKKFIFDHGICPRAFGLEACVRCEENAPRCCEEGWNEEEDACCKNCKYYINFTNPAWRICVAPKIVKNGFMVHVDDNHVCRDWKARGETE